MVSIPGRRSSQTIFFTYIHCLGILVENATVLVVGLTVSNHQVKVLAQVAQTVVFLLLDTSLDVIHADRIRYDDVVVRKVTLRRQLDEGSNNKSLASV